MLKWRFPFLTDTDFAGDSDDRENMLDRLAARIKKTRAELEHLFDEMQRF